MDAGERDLFARAVQHATETCTAEALDAALDEIGWADALATDARVAVAVLFERQGWSHATSSALDVALAHALGAGAGAGTAVALPTLGGWAPPGTVADGSLTVRGLATATLARARTALVASRADDGWAVVAVPCTGLTCDAVSGADAALGLTAVSGQVPLSAPRPLEDWEAAVAVARLALGHELVGAARRMLELAREHALARVQFGRPIGMFQAVRHRLAESLVAVEAADAMLGTAWDDGLPVTAAMAKAMAGRAARAVARHSQQVLAGIGFTTEHSFQQYFRRILVLDQLFGGASTLTRELGAAVLQDRRLPPLQPL